MTVHSASGAIREHFMAANKIKGFHPGFSPQ
jgi:hypothetical protein